ncbi:MAG: ferritin family protein [Nanoarchaeota archaeon]|nr:ferritin family protein [Nanoarchaeota archaeon]
MNEQLKFILEKAMKEEEYFYNFYNDLAERATDEEIKRALRGLAEAEKMHKERLASLNIENVQVDKIDALNISEELGLPSIEEFLDIKTMYEFAIKQEKAAKELYIALAEAVDDENGKKLLLALSEEESKHEQLLAQELDKLR